MITCASGSLTEREGKDLTLARRYGLPRSLCRSVCLFSPVSVFSPPLLQEQSEQRPEVVRAVHVARGGRNQRLPVRVQGGANRGRGGGGGCRVEMAQCGCVRGGCRHWWSRGTDARRKRMVEQIENMTKCPYIEGEERKKGGRE